MYGDEHVICLADNIERGSSMETGSKTPNRPVKTNIPIGIHV